MDIDFGSALVTHYDIELLSATSNPVITPTTVECKNWNYVGIPELSPCHSWV